MSEFPNNSVNKPNNSGNQRTIHPIGQAVEKKPLSAKFSDLFLADSIGVIKTHIVKNILVPNIIRFVADTAHGAIDSFFYKRPGSPTGTGYSTWTPGGSFVNNYGSYFNPNPNMTMAQANDDIYRYKYMGWRTEDQAKRALAELRGDIAQYQKTSVNTYLAMGGITGPLNGWNFGWRNLDTATAYYSGGYWYINFPEPVSLK